LALPWRTLDRAETPAGILELRQRGDRDFLLVVDGRVLMTSAANDSEIRLAQLAIEAAPIGQRPRVLVGGLGLGHTLRAALDALPPTAAVVVAELEPVVVDWCRGPLATINGEAVADPRVRVEVGDVTRTLDAAGADPALRYDAIVLDLFAGPHGRDDPHFGRAGLERIASALRPGGVLAVWSEQPEPVFERVLRAAGYRFSRKRAGRGGRRHAVYLAHPGTRRPRARRAR
jgi:spermidine synthase